MSLSFYLNTIIHTSIKDIIFNFDFEILKLEVRPVLHASKRVIVT